MQKFEALTCYLPHCSRKAEKFVTYNERYVCGFCVDSNHDDDNVITLIDPKKCQYALDLESMINYDKTLRHKWTHFIKELEDFRKKTNELKVDLQMLVQHKKWPKFIDVKHNIDSLKQEWRESSILLEYLKFMNKESTRLRLIGAQNGNLLIAENADLKKTCRELRDEKIDTNIKLNKAIDGLKIQNDHLKNKNDSITAEKDDIVGQLEAAKEQIRELEQQTAQVDELKVQNTKLDRELLKAQTKNKEQASQISDLKSNFQDMKEVSNKSQASMEQLKTTHSQTNDKIEDSFKHLQNI